MNIRVETTNVNTTEAISSAPVAKGKITAAQGEDKERARQHALELFPTAHVLLLRKRDHGRAEAALIALYGVRNSRLITTPSCTKPELIGVPA